MNTTTTSTDFTDLRARIASAILGVLVSTFAAVGSASATDSTGAPQAVVKYADLDISTAQGAAMLYSRIRFTAEGLCEPLNSGDPFSRFRVQECVQRAIEGAVAKVNRPTLSAVYAAKYGVPQAAKILTADRR
jgi:UrcA family protein